MRVCLPVLLPLLITFLPGALHADAELDAIHAQALKRFVVGMKERPMGDYSNGLMLPLC